MTSTPRPRTAGHPRGLCHESTHRASPVPAPLTTLAAGMVWAAEGYTDTPMQPNGKWHVHDPDRPQPAGRHPRQAVQPDGRRPRPTPSSSSTARTSPMDRRQAAARPAAGRSRTATWRSSRATGDIRTKDEFGDCQLHLEFATPEPGRAATARAAATAASTLSAATRSRCSTATTTRPTPTARPARSTASTRRWSTPAAARRVADLRHRLRRPRTSRTTARSSRQAYATVLHNGVARPQPHGAFGRTATATFGNYDKPGRQGPDRAAGPRQPRPLPQHLDPRGQGLRLRRPAGNAAAADATNRPRKIAPASPQTQAAEKSHPDPNGACLRARPVRNVPRGTSPPPSPLYPSPPDTFLHRGEEREPQRHGGTEACPSSLRRAPNQEPQIRK